MRVFLTFLLAGGVFGLLYILKAEPLYTASASIMIEKRQPRVVVNNESAPSDSATLDPVEVDSQLEVLRSERVGLAVVRRLKLADDPALGAGSIGGLVWAPFQAVSKFFRHGDEPKPDENKELRLKRELAALGKIERNLWIIHVPRTNLLKVEYTSPDRNRAADIANAYVNAYMLEQASARTDTSRETRLWLEKRTEELRNLSIDADLAVQKFRAENNLLTTKGTALADQSQTLVSEQQFSEMVSHASQASAATAQAQARYLRIKNIIDTNQTDSAVIDSLNIPVINELRNKYVDASRQSIEFERRLGPNHKAVTNLKNTMKELNMLIFKELGRVAEAYRNEYEIAAAREKALNENLSSQQSIAVSASKSLVQLRRLQEKAANYKKLYQSYLQRLEEALQLEGYPVADGYIVSSASPPLTPSYPRKPLMMGFWLVVGAMFGAGAGALREFRDRSFRSPSQVRETLNTPVLGILPAFTDTAVQRLLRYTIDNRFSTFAETFKSAKVSVDLALNDRRPKIIGVASLLPGEGKTMVAKNLATLLSLQGATTLLVDADMRSSGLTRAMDHGADENVVEVQVWQEWETGLQFFSWDPDSWLVGADGVAAKDLRTFLQESPNPYEYVVVDLPPIGPTSAARGLSPAVDAFILVVEWGSTSRDAIRRALEKEREIAEKLVGVILNKVDMEKLKTYEDAGLDDYYCEQYKDFHEMRSLGPRAADAAKVGMLTGAAAESSLPDAGE